MSLLQNSLKTLLMSFLGLGLSFWLGSQPNVFLTEAAIAEAAPLSFPMSLAYLPPGNAITDGEALLRYALPIENEPVRELQGKLEGLSEWLRTKRWGPVKKDVATVARILDKKRDKLLAGVPSERQSEGSVLIEQLTAGMAPLQAALDIQDKEAVWTQRKQLLGIISKLEALMVKGFPFEVPSEFDALPQLKGRATIEMLTTKGPLTMVVDGYSAPVTAGNFVDLVKRGFYDGLPFIRAEDFYVLQTGDPKGADEGFIDPKTKQYRSIPLEILVKGDDKPIYNHTLEELGRYLDKPVLPFSAFGTLALARPEADVNGGSSQVFFFLFEPELTPAGLNLLDGRYSVFGYTIDGKAVLDQLGAGDFVKSAKVTDGLENLVEPA
jgi:peptidylprolyl isomerase